MLTDSENNMMNQLFSLQSFGGRRFFFVILLLVNLQIVQAACRHSEASLSDTPSSSTALFISKGTFVSGKEQVYIPQPKKEKIKKASKKRNSIVPNTKKYRKEKKSTQSIKGNTKISLVFSRDSQSEKSLLSVSDSGKLIVRPNQHTMKFLVLVPENSTPSLIHLLDVFLKKPHRTHGFSRIVFFGSFKRPPPFLG